VANNKDSLGSYLRNRRTRLDPAAFGFAPGRRRTPGLRREEVAQLANISPTWYTWLEQGRGGAPSVAVLDRIAKGLMLTEPERAHLFMLGLGRPAEVPYKAVQGITPRLQRFLDTLECSPAIVKTATWDVVGWNAAAAALITDYSKLPREERNILRLMFGNSRMRAKREDWSSVARYVVGAFRADVARAGVGARDEVFRLVEELCRLSPEFGVRWHENEIFAHGEGFKCIHHPEAGTLDLEFSSFAIEGRPDLDMIVYNPASPRVAERVRELILAKSA
jgi:transcriptional regulator with XRE-family HTH domain